MVKHLSLAYLNAESFIISVWVCSFRFFFKRKKINSVEDFGASFILFYSVARVSHHINFFFFLAHSLKGNRTKCIIAWTLGAWSSLKYFLSPMNSSCHQCTAMQWLIWDSPRMAGSDSCISIPTSQPDSQPISPMAVPLVCFVGLG